MRFFLTIFVGILVTVVVLVSCQKGINTSNAELNDAAPIPLNLSDEKHQSDFQNYLKKTVDFLNDKSFTYLFRGYNLSNLSRNDKEQIAANMLKDHNFMKKLNAYQSMLGSIEKRYRVSAFTKEQWKEVIKFGMNRGIYFLPGLKEKVKNMEIKSFSFMQSNSNIKTEIYGGTICSDMVDAENESLGSEIQGLVGFCLGLTRFPAAAAICWAGTLAFYLLENGRINSTGYWCDCMITNYGTCVY